MSMKDTVKNRLAALKDTRKDMKAGIHNNEIRHSIGSAEGYINADKKNFPKYLIVSMILSDLLVGLVKGLLRQAGGFVTHLNIFKVMYYGIFFRGSFPVWALVTAILCAVIIRIRAVLYAKDRTYDPRGFIKDPNGTYGSADLMQPEEKGIVFKQEDSVDKVRGDIVGIDVDTHKYLELKEKEKGEMNEDISYDGMRIIAGTSGTGKSVGEIIPDLIQQTLRGESMIITDLKGDIYGKLSKWQEKNGYTVRVFNLIDPMRSDAFNLISLIGSDSTMAQELADALIENTQSDGKGDKSSIFFTGSKALLTFGILYIAMKKDIPDEQKTLGAVYTFLLEHSIEDFEAIAQSLPITNPAKTQWSIFSKASSNLSGNIFVNLMSALQTLTFPQIQAITGYNEIDLSLPAREKCAYYVIMPQGGGAFKYFGAVFFYFLIDRIRHYALLRPDKHARVPVNLMLDEFYNIGRIPGFENGLATWRSMGIACTIAVQNLAQLKDMYNPQTYTSVLDLFDEQIYLGTNSTEDAKAWSAKTGTMSIKTVSEKTQKKLFSLINTDESIDQSVGSGKREVYTADEVQHMSRRYKLVFLTNHNVIKVRKFYYWNHPAAKDFVQTEWTEHEPSWWQVEKDSAWFDDAMNSNVEEEEQARRDYEEDIAKEKGAPSGTAKADTRKEIEAREKIEDESERWNSLSFFDKAKEMLKNGISATLIREREVGMAARAIKDNVNNPDFSVPDAAAEAVEDAPAAGQGEIKAEVPKPKVTFREGESAIDALKRQQEETLSGLSDEEKEAVLSLRRQKQMEREKEKTRQPDETDAKEKEKAIKGSKKPSGEGKKAGDIQKSRIHAIDFSKGINKKKDKSSTLEQLGSPRKAERSAEPENMIDGWSGKL